MCHVYCAASIVAAVTGLLNYIVTRFTCVNQIVNPMEMLSKVERDLYENPDLDDDADANLEDEGASMCPSSCTVVFVMAFIGSVVPAPRHI